jgi:hypothetical protein
MKQKFDMLDTANAELTVSLISLDVKVEKMVEASDKEERERLAEEIYFLEEDIRSLVRKVIRKGTIYRDLADKTE